jgi:Spy/CpxP family protein refolding chaperone
MEEVAKELKLTDEQKEKLKPIFEAEQEKIKGIIADTNLSREEKISWMGRIGRMISRGWMFKPAIGEMVDDAAGR